MMDKKIKNRVKVALAIGSLVCAFSVPVQAALNTGLVAHWSFDDCSANDSSGYHFDGTIQGTPQCTEGVTLNGITGKSLQFNGSTDWIEGSINANIFAADWSIAAWFYHTGYGSPWEAIFSNSTNGINNTALMTFKGSGNEANVQNYLGINAVGTADNGTFVNLASHFNQWIFAVISYKKGIPTIYAYKNGKLIKTSQALSWTLQQSNGFYIGRHYHLAVTQLFKGKIDEVKIYNRALSATEVSSLYNQSIDVSGAIKGFNPTGFAVQCQNVTTGQTVAVASVAFNCEAAGLVVNPNDVIHINIDGKAK
jgi:hypothetical protein